MRKRPLGDTGLVISELALGTWGLCGDATLPVTENEQDRVLDRALAVGITLFETADCYAHGQMEERIGRRIPGEGRAHVATKIGTDRDAAPPRKRFDVNFLRERFERSAERLKRNTIDILLLHNPSLVAVERGEATGLLDELKTQKRIFAWGVSAGSTEVARAAIERGAKVVELAYNVFHGSDLRELAVEVEKRGVGVLARSVLAHGLLCGHWPPDKVFSPSDHRAERWTADELRRRVRQLDALRPVVGGPIMTLRAAALRWVLHNQRVSAAVLGPRSSLQLDQLVREAGREPPYLGDDSIRALDARLTQVGVAP
jgi:aryl-alcohol dehydrogenase-like predicted oxidoreductase